MGEIFTIGYGNREIDDFVNLLSQHGVTAVCDVRSMPYSKRYQAYNRESLKSTLASFHVRYLFFGDVLGARPSDRDLYVSGRASYALIEGSPPFQHGLERLELGVKSFTIALMCAEKEPLDCHRAILISRALERIGITVTHIGSDGSLERHEILEQRMLRKYGLEQSSLLEPIATEEAIQRAYEKRASELSYDLYAAHRSKAQL